MDTLTHQLIHQLEKLPVTASLNHLDTLAKQLALYLTLLHKWNQTYNLTAVREIEAMIGRHVLDSLAILPWINGPCVLDVGTGAGLPGIPLALVNTNMTFVLLDSNGKKTRFLQEVKRQLQLHHVDVVQSRVEDYQPDWGFDTVVSRAFSSIKEMVTGTQHLLKPRGIWLAMKGVSPLEELREIHYPYRLEAYHVPSVQGERCCAIITKD